MRTEQVTIYKFSELSKDVQDKVIEKFRYLNTEDMEWWDSVYDDAENIGLKITSFDLDRNRHAKGEFQLSANEVAQNILNGHGEHCETFKTAKSFMGEWQPVFSEYMDEASPNYESRESEEKLLELEKDFLKSILEDYSIMLQRECEYLTSDEAVRETIEANDYEFYADGRQV